MKIEYGKMTKESLQALLKAKCVTIWTERDEVYNERKKEVLDENELNELDDTYKFKLIEYTNQLVEDYYVVVCY